MTFHTHKSLKKYQQKPKSGFKVDSQWSDSRIEGRWYLLNTVRTSALACMFISERDQDYWAEQDFRG